MTLTAAEDVRRVRAVLALGGVPWGELDDGVQEVRLKLREVQTKDHRQQIRKPAAWLSVVASRVATDWHRRD
jgi:RNA polymerase sigma-70 factor (ECF subfamily)